jgi:hypothetical protein
MRRRFYKPKVTIKFTKGVRKMPTVLIQEPDVKLNCISNIRNRAKSAMKAKNLTEKDIRKFLGIKRYEKV